MKYRNSEGYADPTAGAAFAHIEYEERLKKRLEKKKRRNAAKKKRPGIGNATVQILSVDFDETGRVWYQVRFLYGDDFKAGTMKWTDYATAWILPDETGESAEEGCTVTDFAYTLEYLQQVRNSGRRMLKASPMNGFTLKNIGWKKFTTCIRIRSMMVHMFGSFFLM